MSEAEARALIARRVADAVDAAPPLPPEAERRLRELIALVTATLAEREHAEGVRRVVTDTDGVRGQRIERRAPQPPWQALDTPDSAANARTRAAAAEVARSAPPPSDAVIERLRPLLGYDRD